MKSEYKNQTLPYNYRFIHTKNFETRVSTCVNSSLSEAYLHNGTKEVDATIPRMRRIAHILKGKVKHIFHTLDYGTDHSIRGKERHEIK